MTEEDVYLELASRYNWTFSEIADMSPCEVFHALKTKGENRGYLAEGQMSFNSYEEYGKWLISQK